MYTYTVPYTPCRNGNQGCVVDVMGVYQITIPNAHPMQPKNVNGVRFHVMNYDSNAVFLRPICTFGSSGAVQWDCAEFGTIDATVLSFSARDSPAFGQGMRVTFTNTVYRDLLLNLLRTDPYFARMGMKEGNDTCELVDKSRIAIK